MASKIGSLVARNAGRQSRKLLTRLGQTASVLRALPTSASHLAASPLEPRRNLSRHYSWNQNQARQFTGTPAAASKILAVTSDDEFASAMKEVQHENKLAVVDFTAVWCGPCRAIAPFFEKLSNELGDVKFLKVDIDQEELQETVSAAGIRAVPTFQFYKGGHKVAELSGADPAKLQELITTLR